MMNAFIVSDIAAPILGGILLVIAVWLWLKASFLGRRAMAVVLALLGLPILVGSIAYLIGARTELAGWTEAPGEEIAIANGKVHLWCEGASETDRPTLILIAGGHGAGINLYPLQQRLATDQRACLIDRLGTGWSSDPKSGRRNVATISAELQAALDASNEKGPFIVVGHSLGGMVAATLAAQPPENGVVALVTLDPTPHAMIDYALKRPDSWCYGEPSALMALGSRLGAAHLLPSLHPFNSPDWEEENAALREVKEPLKAQESRPASILYGNEALSIMCHERDGVARGDGLLGDMPVLSIVQAPESFADKSWEELTNKERQSLQQWNGVTDVAAFEAYKQMTQAAAQEYPGLSENGRLLLAPQGAGHNFPVTRPDFTASAIRDALSDWFADVRD